MGGLVGCCNGWCAIFFSRFSRGRRSVSSCLLSKFAVLVLKLEEKVLFGLPARDVRSCHVVIGSTDRSRQAS